MRLVGALRVTQIVGVDPVAVLPGVWFQISSSVLMRYFKPIA